ncbi:TonB-dependent receptor plug domain-containing protein [Frateuria soli]|uniref:TonB-dependent receptor plug domain-containing protein n=1 Tax=Frateuria soli TaxID=1542730 RepID=UPI001E39F3DD|nr:TonB-dependent receptor [Frateuria soli]UGB39198.1 TonB-dependent receptor [Frateuria soli]
MSPGQRALTRSAIATGLLMLSMRAPCAALALPTDLGSLTLEDLGKVVVSSVTKNPEPLAKAPAAVYVISHDDIMRSGARSLPDILRLAPNLEVFQTSPGNYVITARGFNGNNIAQSFPNKLLVLIDGRSVYSPIFSGMYWDDQFVLPEDIERIEVISGPGGALWGANAVNGVINVITRSAADTRGGLLAVRVGNLESSAAVQYGGALGRDAHYRVYARNIRRHELDDAAGQPARNGWNSPQVGFRIDWDHGPADSIMLQGDLHDGRTDQPGADDARSTGADVLARWRHTISDTSNVQFQAYYDHVHRRGSNDGGSGFTLDTLDVEMQHGLAVGKRQQLLWGLGDRIYRYDIKPRIATASSLLWDPPRNTQSLVNAFVQDQVALTPGTTLTLGLKAEDDPYSGLSLMPRLRLSWQPGRSSLLWAAASRAVRTPTPFDEDVIEKLGPTVFLTGNPAFKREKLTAYEAGWRGQVATRATVSVSLYYNVYDDLRTVELSPTGLPLTWGNGMEGHTCGVEVWGSYAVSDWWQLGAGIDAQRQRLRFKPEASGLLGVSQAGDDPEYQGFVRSMMNLSDHWTLYADVRGVDALPDPKVPGYVELDLRLGWLVDDKLELSLAGSNLLHAWHQEYPFGNRIGRGVSLDARLNF